MKKYDFNFRSLGNIFCGNQFFFSWKHKINRETSNEDATRFAVNG